MILLWDPTELVSLSARHPQWFIYIPNCDATHINMTPIHEGYTVPNTDSQVLIPYIMHAMSGY